MIGERSGEARLLGALVAVDDRQVAVLDAEPGGHLGVVGMALATTGTSIARSPLRRRWRRSLRQCDCGHEDGDARAVRR